MPLPLFLTLAAGGILIDWDRLPPFTSLVIAVLVVCFYFAFFGPTSTDKWR